MSCDLAFSAGQLRVAGEMTIYAASELKAALVEHLRAHSAPLVLNLAEVTEIDSSGLQLLLMLRRESPALQIADASAVVRDTLSLCGLTQLIAA
jgi:anti-sigma B factor antagonist